MSSKAGKHRLVFEHKLASVANKLEQSTNFSAEEIKLLLIVHQKIEAVSPLDRPMFREVLCVVFEISDDIMLDLTFRAFDRDGDGLVNASEWVHGLSVMLRGTIEQLTDFCYLVYDMNGDKSLEREELYYCLKGCIYPGYGLDIDEIDDCEREIVDIVMRKLDNDRDGQITYEDFVRAVKADNLMLQACGTCLPTSGRAAAFQSLITDRYRITAALISKHGRQRRSKHGHRHGHRHHGQRHHSGGKSGGRGGVTQSLNPLQGFMQESKSLAVMSIAPSSVDMGDSESVMDYGDSKYSMVGGKQSTIGGSTFGLRFPVDKYFDLRIAIAEEQEAREQRAKSRVGSFGTKSSGSRKSS